MDDVNYLLNSAREESYLFVVDSRARDTAVFPTPSEYEIAFASPFRNVFGLDVLDATVARTEYIVESNTNSLDYVMGQPAALAGPEGRAWNQGAWVTSAVDALGQPTPRRTVRLDPGDYNLPQFIEHLNAKLAEAAAAHGEPPIRCAALTRPAEVSNRVTFTCARAFTFLMDTSTLRHTLGFGDPVQTTASPDYATVPGWTVNRTGGASDAFLSLPGSTIPDADPQDALLGPLPAGDETSAEPLFGAKVVRQFFESAATGPATDASVYAFGTPGCPSLEVSVARASDDLVMASGGAQVAPDDPNSTYEPVRCALAPAAGLILEAGERYYVEFRAAEGAGSATEFVGLYFNADNLATQAARYVTVDGAAAHPGQNLCVDVTCASWGHAVRCPGVVNLTGPRYVNIRCPDIESHMFRDRVNEACHAGMGLVQLRGYGFREQRFDFVSFPPRRFHPVGKISKLRFRLERPDGSLYDSHGVDHTLLLVLRYYSMPASATNNDRRAAPAPAAAAAAQHRSSLNPDYVPDLRQYMITRHWREEERALDRIDKRY
jgi:hypothetical protein